MLEKYLEDLARWNKLGEVMSKRPVSYFISENARGEYAGWLKTRAWMENRLATQMDLEAENGVSPVEVKVGKQY